MSNSDSEQNVSNNKPNDKEKAASLKAVPLYLSLGYMQMNTWLLY